MNTMNLLDMSTILEQQIIDEFVAGFQGAVILSGDDEYNETRKIWNGMIDKYPALIAQCTGPADVIHAVNFARNNGLEVSVRGGGHNVAGSSLVDDGLVIDLSLMKGVHIDPNTRTAHVQPGVRWGEFDREAQVFGLAVPGGLISDTGVAGLTLGGGFGWLSRKYGFSADNLISLDVVMADGRLVTASETQNADLFWGMRGGAGNFGIAVGFEFQLHAVGTQVLAGSIIYRLEDASDVLRFFRDFSIDAPRELGSFVVFRTAPDAPFIPHDVVGKPVLAVIPTYIGDIETGKEVLKPLLEFGSPIFNGVSVKNYVAHQQAFDAGQPTGHRYYWKSEYIHEIADSAIDTLVHYASMMTSPSARLAMFQLGGAIQDRDEFSMAVSHRHTEYVIGINTGWTNAADDEKEISWTRNLWQEIRQYSNGGVYVNFLSQGEGQERVQAAYGERKHARLVELKNRYDPNNFFHINQNIKPTI